ncbi:MAG: BTAD domain-containing putative transcriptional regulator [Caldilineaceae bacterium]
MLHFDTRRCEPRPKEICMQLSLSLLGRFSAAIDGQEIPESRTKKIEALLAYLVVEFDRRHRRENLVGLLFPEMLDDVASTNLRQTLTRLRRAIGDEDASPSFLTITRESLQFNRQSEHWCDLFEFETLLWGCADHPTGRVESCVYCMSRMREALEIYRGPFLADFFLADSAAFEDWAATIREQVQHKVLAALDMLTTFHSRRGEYAQAIVYGRRQVEIEPWREEAHRLLMRLLARTGRRTDALVQYKHCIEALQRELDVEPSLATMCLREQIAALGETRPSNLLVLDELFIGRHKEIAHVYAHFSDNRSRLLTLVGAGGIGKTHLALEVGRRIAHEFLGPFMHGVYFVSLAEMAPAVDAEQTLAIAIADCLSISLVGVRSPLDLVLGYLQDKELLLIFDNCEEAGSAVVILDKLLKQAPDLQILTTSREPLDLANEQLIRLDGLSFPPIASHVIGAFGAHGSMGSDPVGAISNSERANDDVQFQAYQAVQLFAHHAHRADAAFVWEQAESSEQQAIARICQVCEGMPLALEMAAVWVQMLPCREIASEIERNLDILKGHQHQRPARHDSIRAVFDYSWARLTAAEQAVFAQLSVFRGGFDRTAAHAVTDTSLPTVASLVRKSLVRHDKSGKSRSGRYSLHPLLRQYAAEKLVADRAQEAETQARHGRYYCAWLHQQTPDLKGGAQQQVIATVSLELDNVRQAWRWAVTNQNKDAINLAVDGFTDFCELRGLFVEGEELLGQAAAELQMAQRESEDDATAIVVAKTLARQGWMRFLLGRSAQAQRQLEEAIGILQVLNVWEEIIIPLNALAYVVYCMDQYSLALEKSQQAKAFAEAQGDLLGQANALRTTAAVAQNQGYLKESIEQYEAALALYQQIGNGQGACWSLLSICTSICLLGNYDGAIQRGKELVKLCQEIGYRLGEGWAVSSLSYYYLAHGDYAKAVETLEHALRIGHEMNDRRLQGNVLHRQGIYLRSQGQLAQAQMALQQSLAIFQDVSNALAEGRVLNELGILERNADHHDASLTLHQRALEIGQRIGSQELQYRSFACLGHTYLALARLIQAQTAYEQAVERVDKSQLQQMLHPLSGLAHVAALRNEADSAKKILHEVFAVVNICGLNNAEDPQSFLQNLQQALGIVNDEQLASFAQAIFEKASSIPFYRHSHPIGR